MLKLTSMLWGHWSTGRKHWGTERTGLSEAHRHHACVGTLSVWLETNTGRAFPIRESASGQRGGMDPEWTLKEVSAPILHFFYFHVLIQPSHQRKWAFFSSSFYTSWMFYIKRLAKKKREKSNIWWCWTGHRDHGSANELKAVTSGFAVLRCYCGGNTIISN